MKRVLIVTIIDYSNYGNRLQNYALAEMLKSLSLNVTCGLELFSKENADHLSGKWEQILKPVLPFCLYKVLSEVWRMSRPAIEREREHRFRNFSDQYLQMLPRIYVNKSSELEEKISLDYDYYIAGSDQIWNPYFAGADYQFLTFAPSDKRIAFSASFGAKELGQNEAKRYARRLNDFAYISVREQSGAGIVKKLTGKVADVVLDPTLLLLQGEWERILKKPSLQLPKHYMLAFFLGEKPKTAIDRFSMQQDIPVLYMNCKSYPDLYVLDPSEFLYMVKKADYVLTDSFHGTVFSVKFNREFYVFRRRQKGMENMFTRITDLLTRFGLEERIQEWDAVRKAPVVPDWQWQKICAVLEEEREKTMKKLQELLI